ncbi:glycoside hydrolase family 31 protein [Termitidicoccus mucosus]|uniref:Glycoside hydrolase family 31 N-terminal domain-containing protein n=1 Tax=Termitidicoccus mucosus TaxID=1184151 RepID=A0A178IG19_9BACT|nr:hypothetical protein AW736_18600 [Opitutaceae bacterium TSB47]
MRKFSFLLCFSVFGLHLSVFSAALTFEESRDEIRVGNENATLVLAKNPWRLSLLAPDGAVQFAEAAAPEFKMGDTWFPVSQVTSMDQNGRLAVVLADATRGVVEISAAGAGGFRIVIRAETRTVSAVRGATMLAPVEEIYGFGEMWNGRVAQRGAAFDLWAAGGTPDECAYMPYYVSTKNYAFFLDYGGRVHFDVGRNRADRITYEAPADTLDLTLVRGGDIPSVVRGFFTGRGLPKQPPRWSLKPWFWLMADPEQPGAKIETLKGRHFIDMVKKLDALSIPVGTTWLEPPWQDARTSFNPDPGFDPDLKGTIAELRGMGVRTLAWTVPYTTKNASNWAEAVEHGYLVQKPSGDVKTADAVVTGSGELMVGRLYNYIDFFNPEARDWWKRQIVRSLDTGIAGFKLDAGQDLEPDAVLHGGRRGADVRNSYAMEYNRVFHEALSSRLGDDYLMIPRAGWMGSAAHHNFKWPGDLAGSFANNGLPSSVYSTLSLAFCGAPFLSTDIGGFEDQPAPEKVWLRWAQFGAFLPGMQTLHMPWWYSEESVRHFRFLAWLHTDMIPFWQSLGHEAAATAAPMVRPLVWTWQHDIDCWRVDDEFTVGEALLVAPMLNANPDRKVYLPAGRWHDFWNDRRVVTGPRTETWFEGWSTIDKFPLYIREGAIIPMEVANTFSGFGWPESAGYITLAIWPKLRGESSFTLRDTEGPVRITAARNDDASLVLTWDATRRNHLLRVHIDGSSVPREVRADGVLLAKTSDLDAFRKTAAECWHYDAAEQKLWIRKLNNGSATSIEVRLKP